MNAIKKIMLLASAAGTALFPVESRPAPTIEVSRPAVIPASMTPRTRSQVTFKSRARSSHAYPDELVLQEVDRRGDVVNPRVAILLDDGKGVDARARDGIYSAVADIHSSHEGAKYFRLYP